MTAITYFLLGFLSGIIFTIVIAFWLGNRNIMKNKSEAVIKREAEEFVNIFLDYSKVRNN